MFNVCYIKSAGLLSRQGASVSAHACRSWWCSHLTGQQLLNRTDVLAPFQEGALQRSGERYGSWQLCSRQALANRLVQRLVCPPRWVEVGVFPGAPVVRSKPAFLLGNTPLPRPACQIPLVFNRRISNRCCERSAILLGAGNVSRSFPPLPSEPTSSRRFESRSFTVILSASISRRPLPYNRPNHQCRHPF